MKPFLALALFLILCPFHFADAQDVRISPVVSQNSGETFSFAGPEGKTWDILSEGFTLNLIRQDITLRDVFSFDISPDGRHLGVLILNDDPTIEIYNFEGEKIALYTNLPDVNPEDPSIKLFMLARGSVVLRDNIVSFTLFRHRFDGGGAANLIAGNLQAQTISRLAASPNGIYTYVYIPRIVGDSGFSSRISRLDPDAELSTLNQDFERELLQVAVSDDGSEILAVKRDANETVTLQRFSNDGTVIEETEAPFANAGFYIQPDIGTITWFSGHRAETYDINSGERLANAFLRQNNRIFLAKYDPDDNVVVTLTGSRNNREQTMTVRSAFVVDLNARSILRSDTINQTVDFTEHITPGIIKARTNHYRLTGVTNAFNIQINN